MYKYIYLKNNKYSINNKNGKNILVKYIQYYLKGGVEAKHDNNDSYMLDIILFKNNIILNLLSIFYEFNLKYSQITRQKLHIVLSSCRNWQILFACLLMIINDNSQVVKDDILNLKTSTKVKKLHVLHSLFTNSIYRKSFHKELQMISYPIYYYITNNQISRKCLQPPITMENPNDSFFNTLYNFYPFFIYFRDINKLSGYEKDNNIIHYFFIIKLSSKYYISSSWGCSSECIGFISIKPITKEINMQEFYQFCKILMSDDQINKQEHIKRLKFVEKFIIDYFFDIKYARNCRRSKEDIDDYISDDDDDISPKQKKRKQYERKKLASKVFKPKDEIQKQIYSPNGFIQNYLGTNLAKPNYKLGVAMYQNIMHDLKRIYSKI